MKVFTVLAVALVGLAELAILLTPERDAALLAAGLTAAAGILGTRWLLTLGGTARDDSYARDPAESLRRWLARTETLVARADTTRGFCCSRWCRYGAISVTGAKCRRRSGSWKSITSAAAMCDAVICSGQHVEDVPLTNTGCGRDEFDAK